MSENRVIHIDFLSVLVVINDKMYWSLPARGFILVNERGMNQLHYKEMKWKSIIHIVTYMYKIKTGKFKN